MSNDIIASDLHSQHVDNLVTLFILEMNNGNKLYFHAGVDNNLASVTFRDDTSPYTIRTYTALPIDLTGIEVKGDGSSNRPILTIANVLPIFRDLLTDFDYNKVVGSRLTKRITLKTHLTSGSDSSAPVEFPKVTYIVDRLKAETSQFVTFELASPFDVEGITLPRRTVVGKYCSWKYKQFPDGGCFFNNKRRLGDLSNRSHHVFFTLKDELVTNSSNVTSAQAYSSTTTYSSDTVVEHSSNFYQSMADFNEGNIPTTNDGHWRKVFKYSDWDNGRNYVIDDFVIFQEVLWRCIANHTSVVYKYPSSLPTLWEHGDLCGKTLNSCNIRYSAQITPTGADDALVSTTPKNDKTLPFGGFPGSSKHR